MLDLNTNRQWNNLQIFILKMKATYFVLSNLFSSLFSIFSLIFFYMIGFWLLSSKVLYIFFQCILYYPNLSPSSYPSPISPAFSLPSLSSAWVRNLCEICRRKLLVRNLVNPKQKELNTIYISEWAHERLDH